jgi:hypothetical protein
MVGISFIWGAFHIIGKNPKNQIVENGRIQAWKVNGHQVTAFYPPVSFSYMLTFLAIGFLAQHVKILK